MALTVGSWRRARGMFPAVLLATGLVGACGAASQTPASATHTTLRTETVYSASPRVGSRLGSRIYRLISATVSRPVQGVPSDSFAPAWDPDGTELAFFHVTGDVITLEALHQGGQNARPRVLYTCKGGIDVCTEGMASPPSWSPDGTQIAFPGPRGLLTIPSSGGSPHKLTHTRDAPGEEEFPGWSPNGNLVVFSRSRATDTGLWSVSSAGGKLRK